MIEILALKLTHEFEFPYFLWTLYIEHNAEGGKRKLCPDYELTKDTQPHDCWFNRSFRHRSKKTSKLRVTGLCAGNLPETGEFPAQMASNAENISI